MGKLILAIVLTLVSIFANAQLKGSGKTVSKTYNYKNFDRIALEDLDGEIEVEIGKPYSISVIVDDNLENLLLISENLTEKELKVQFNENKNNKKYIENTNLKIKITLPAATAIKNSGNSELVVKNIAGSFFKLENEGNGSTKINGAIDFLEIIKTGNGAIFAKDLVAQSADLKSAGNGELTVNVSEKLLARLVGNGNIINKGKAKFDAESKKSGNGALIIN